MIRVLTVLAAVVALAVSAQPASAAYHLVDAWASKWAPSQAAVANHTEGTVSLTAFQPEAVKFRASSGKLDYRG